MGIGVNIRKKLDAFELNIEFQSSSKRIGILGASGCGKSMTLKCIAGIEKPDAGKISVGEHLFFDSGQKVDVKTQKRRVGYMFQNYALFPTMTVEENIAAGLLGSKEENRNVVKEMISRFHLDGLQKRLPGKLSGGQQQRVALARIMAYEPEVILLDEPFSALDLYLKDEMQREMLELLKDYEGTVIMVSHNRDEVYRMSEELLVLDEGKLIRQGKTKEVFEQPGYISAARLTGCKNITSIEHMEDRIWSEGWKIFLPLADEEVCAAAIRAHQFLIEEKEEGMIPFPVKNPVVTEDMFEYNISFQTSEDAKQRLNWKISKSIWRQETDAMPEILYLKKEDLLLLKK